MQLGTIDYPYKDLAKAFVEIFNFYDNFPNENLKVMVASNQASRIAWGFKDSPLIVVDKNISIDTYNATTKFQVMLNATDKSKL